MMNMLNFASRMSLIGSRCERGGGAVTADCVPRPPATQVPRELVPSI